MKAKKKTLLIDFDPQGNSTSGYGIEKDELEYDIYDGKFSTRPNRFPHSLTPEDRVYVIPATIQFFAGAEIELVNEEDREHILKQLSR